MKTVVTIVVTIEREDGSVDFRTWTGPSAKRIKEAAIRRYLGVKLTFGKPLSNQSFGAH